MMTGSPIDRAPSCYSVVPLNTARARPDCLTATTGTREKGKCTNIYIYTYICNLAGD